MKNMGKFKAILYKILDFFYNIFNKGKSDIKNVRRVYFGLNIRMLALFWLLLLIILTVTSTIFFFHQKSSILDEKRKKTDILAQTLGALFESYIDRDINTTRAELARKKSLVEENSNYFKKFNDEIFKIFVTDEKGIIRHSTDIRAKEINTKAKATYVDRCLSEKEIIKGYTFDYSYKEKVKDKEGNMVEKEKTITYEIITYPILISKGYIIDILADFDKYYEKYHKSPKNEKDKIYLALWKKYKEHLGEEFAPTKEGGFDAMKITKAHDIDFLFHQLFIFVMRNKQKHYKKGEEYLWRTRWLIDEKQKIITAYSNDLPEDAKKSKTLIIERLRFLKERIEEVKLLGSITIMYNIDELKAKVNQSLGSFIIISLIIFIITMIIFLVVTVHLVKNLKLLEKGAQEFGMANFDSKIHISTNDETGRLADILNNMAVDIKEKLHMEKFISKSTKSMIKSVSSSGTEVVPGTVQKLELSFIFADVRGFTAFSEKNKPEIVVDTLNLYFDVQYQIVRKYMGDIDDYVGDQIMAHFGGRNHREKSCRAAIEILKKIEMLNVKRQKQGLPCFEVGIGVHSGIVVTGNIGASGRMDFACVGDAVNTTSRLCSHAKPSEILVSNEHIRTIKDKFELGRKAPIEAKGKKDKISVSKLLNIKRGTIG